MRTKSFTYDNGDLGEVKIAVRRGTVRDRLARDAMVWELPKATSTAERHAQLNFATVVIQTVSLEGDLGFAWPTPDASAEELTAAYNALMEVDAALWDNWHAAIMVADGSIADPELSEPPKKTDGAKESTPKSA